MGKQPLGHGAKMRRRRHGHIFLAFEMMEERALGHPRLPAEIIHRSCRITLRTDDLEARIQQLGFRIGRSLGLGHGPLLDT